MATNELHLDELTYARAKRLADERNVSVEQVVSEAIEGLSVQTAQSAPGRDVIGSFSDCADLLDEIVEEAYLNRAHYPLRLKTG